MLCIEVTDVCAKGDVHALVDGDVRVGELGDGLAVTEDNVVV